MTIPKTLELAAICKELALEKKATNPVILDLGEINGPAECFLLCSGAAEPQLKAIANSIEVGLKERLSLKPYSRDGRTGSRWLVLDYGSVVVHIMHEEIREFYGLETLWRDAKRVA